MWRGNWRVPPAQRRQALMVELQQLQQQLLSCQHGRFDSEEVQQRFDELSQHLATPEPAVAVDGAVLLDADVLHMLCEALGAVRFLYASCCRQWFDAARTLQGDHTLWKEACMALSPLLTSMHSPASHVTWKQLLKQRRLADRRPVAKRVRERQYNDCDMSFELIDSATNAVLRHGTARLAQEAFDLHADALHEFEFVTPLKVGVFFEAGQTDCVQLEALRLSLYLACGSRMCCLVRNSGHDNDGIDSWFIFDCEQTRFHVKMQFTTVNEPVDSRRDYLCGIQVDVQVGEYVWERPFCDLLDHLDVDEHHWVQQ